MDGKSYCVNQNSQANFGSLDFWDYQYPEQFGLENPFSVASSAIRPTSSAHLVRTGIASMAG